MSTIHAIYTQQQALKDSLAEKILSASNYWQPDTTSYQICNKSKAMLTKATLFNTSYSQNDNVYHDPDNNIISANARIDNRAELAQQLAINEHDLKCLSDGELILKCYRYWGETTPKQLLGDFVFIIWDELQKQFFCARDHMGVKVLYYCHNKKGTMVSNEHNAFFTTQWQSKKIKERWLIEQIWGQGPSAVESPCNGIEVLPAAHSMIINADGVQLKRYWSLEMKDDWQEWDDEALISELTTRFKRAVSVRLQSRYPVSCELSEGLDSNGIAGHAAKMLGDKPLYTVSYKCQRLNDDNRKIWEDTYRDIFAMHQLHDNIQPLWTTKPENNMENNLREQTEQQGMLMSSRTGPINYLELAQQQQSRVLLSGWGGDHCVSAPGDYYEDELFSQGRWLTLQQLIKDKLKRGRGTKPIKAWLHLLVKHFTPSLYHILQRHRNGLEKALWQRAKISPLRQKYIKKYRLKQQLKQFLNNYQRTSVRGYEDRELFEIGLENRMVMHELNARTYGIEYRFPMLDVPLLELAYNMPPHLKMYHGTERYMFRRILEGVTTSRIQWRRKADVDLPNIDRNKPSVDNGDLIKHYQRYVEPKKIQAATDKNPMFHHTMEFLIALQSINTTVSETQDAG